MKIGIFGLGYVGLTTAACLLEKGFSVVGYEVSERKRELLARGNCPLSEPGVELHLLPALQSGKFTVQVEVDPGDAPEIIFICVGTPSAEDGSTDLRAVNHVFEHLDALAAAHSTFASEVVLRSTVPPGTLGQLCLRYENLFRQVPVLFYPEFLRESTAMEDFNNPPQTVLGAVAGNPPAHKVPGLFRTLGFEHELVDSTAAESLKFACNAFHAIKVCFANEIGRLVSASGGDANEVMRLFCKDTQLNISSRYLKPGNPYGGSCLPKDTRSMAHLGNRLGLNLELVKACETSNRSHFDHVIRALEKYQPKVIALLGFAFKKDTDDIRESPSLELLHRLMARQDYKIRAHDFLVREETAVGVNKKLLDRLMPLPGFSFHREIAETLAGAEVILIMHPDARYRDVPVPPGARLFNLAEWKNL